LHCCLEKLRAKPLAQSRVRIVCEVVVRRER
jgi:hypothetical protein